MEINKNRLQERRKLYEKNIKVLSKRYPKIVEKINNAREKTDFKIGLTGKRNLPNIFSNKLGKYYYDENDQIEDVKAQIFSLNLQKTSIAIFLGFGLGYELLLYGNELSEKLKTQQLLVIEKSVELFKQILEWVDLTKLVQDERVTLIVGMDNMEMEFAIKEYLSDEKKLRCLDAISTIYHQSALLLEEEYYLNAISIFNQVGTNILAERNNINTVYENNMKALSEYYPDLWKQISNLKESGNYKIVKTGSENIANLWIEDKKTLYYNFENPMLDAEHQIEELKLRNTRVALFLGCGLGYELDLFKKIASEQNTVGIIIVEKDIEIFKKALEVTDLTEYISKSKINIIVGLNPENLFMEFQHFFEKYNDILWLMKTLKPIYISTSILLDKEYYLNSIREIKKASTYMINYYGNDPEDSIIGTENMLLNLNEIINNPGINLLKNKFKDKPAVVVSSGPSLNKNKHLLKGIENKAVIIAADSALRVLTQIGVKPHFVTALERVKSVVRLLKGFTEEETKDVYLAACPVVDPEMYEHYLGPRLIVYRDFNHFKWIDIDRGILEIKQSAGNMSFKIAEYLGCNPIILIGQDLAFGEDGNTHGEGTDLHGDDDVKTMYEQMDSIEVKGNIKEKVLTNSSWYNFIRGYEQDLREYNGKCINSTEGGAYINGTMVIPFAEAISKYITEDIDTLNEIKKYTSKNFQDSEKEIIKVKKIIDETIECMEKLINTCKDGELLCEKYQEELECYLKSEEDLQDKDTQRIISIEKKFLEIKSNLIQDKKIFKEFFMHIIQPYLIKFEMDMSAIPDNYSNESLAKVKMMSEQYRLFKAVSGIADICKTMLIKSKEKIESPN